MSDHRIGLDLFNDVLDVLDRHGFTRGDDQHAGRAIFLISDLARIYEGTQDHPVGPTSSQAPTPMRMRGQARPIHSSSKMPRVCSNSTRPMTMRTTAPKGCRCARGSMASGSL